MSSVDIVEKIRAHCKQGRRPMRPTRRGVMSYDIGTPEHGVAAPRGTDLTCLGWQQEAAYRMLQNNLDPEVAENPDQLVVYGGTGRAARSWPAYRAISRPRLRG